MAEWTIDAPQELTLDDVREARVRLIAGEVSVTATDGPARLEVHDIEGDGLRVTLVDGVLEVTHPELTWGGLLSFATKRGRRSAVVSLAIPAAVALRLGVVSASAVVTGLTAATEVRSVSGDVTLDGISADVAAESVSGDLEAVSLTGDLDMKTVSGDLTLAGGTSRTVRVKSVSGDITLDVDLSTGGELRADAVSGDVAVRLPDSLSAKVDVVSVSGSLSSAYDDVAESRSPGKRSMSGVIGDGASQVRIRTVSGDASLLSRSAAAASAR